MQQIEEEESKLIMIDTTDAKRQNGFVKDQESENEIEDYPRRE